MSATICPTVTVSDEHDYNLQVITLSGFAKRIHIDLSDGVFTPEKLISIDKVWWPGNVRADLHVMYENPFEHIASLVALGPQVIITHAEANGDFIHYAGYIHENGIETGIAILPETSVEDIRSLIDWVDHVLIFAGKLGYQGGEADMTQINKVAELKALKPSVEISWDGGINDKNAQQLIDAGVEVLNVGGFIAHSDNPQAAYAKLKEIGGET